MSPVYNLYPKKRSIFGSLSVNAIIILINILLFVVFSILLYVNENYIDYIAIKSSNILHGQYLWTFLTSMFMHAGFFHIFANMVSLLFIGSLVEKILGRKRYFYFYMICGLFASLFFVLTSFFITSDLNTYAVGASGAIFGLVGLLMIITPNLPVYIFFIPIPIKMKYAAPGILVALWLISSLGNIPIGNTAHLGGLIAGLFFGIYLRTKYKNKTRYISQHFS